MRKFLASVLAAAGLAFGVAIAIPAPAVADQTFYCSTDGGHLVGRATRVNFGGGKSAIVGQMNTHTHDVFLGTDRVYRPHKYVSASGRLQPRYYTSKTTWGSLTNPLDFQTEYITMYWYGQTVHGQPIAGKYCTVKVGV